LWVGHREEADELRMVTIAGRAASEDLLRQQCFTPQGNETASIKVACPGGPFY
jgi:hypothetical protein